MPIDLIVEMKRREERITPQAVNMHAHARIFSPLFLLAITLRGALRELI